MQLPVTVVKYCLLMLTTSGDELNLSPSDNILDKPAYDFSHNHDDEYYQNTSRTLIEEIV